MLQRGLAVDAAGKVTVGLCVRDVDCPVCYNVVQQSVNALRQSILNLRLIIENIGEHPETINDTDFRRQLTVVNVTVTRLYEDAKRLSGMLPSVVTIDVKGKGKSSPYSITDRRVSELIPVLGSQPADDVSHKPGGMLLLLSAMPAVTPATHMRAATNFAAY